MRNGEQSCSSNLGGGEGRGAKSHRRLWPRAKGLRRGVGERTASSQTQAHSTHTNSYSLLPRTSSHPSIREELASLLASHSSQSASKKRLGTYSSLSSTSMHLEGLPSVAQGCRDVNNDPTMVLGKERRHGIRREQHKGSHRGVVGQDSWARRDSHP